MQKVLEIIRVIFRCHFYIICVWLCVYAFVYVLMSVFVFECVCIFCVYVCVYVSGCMCVCVSVLCVSVSSFFVCRCVNPYSDALRYTPTPDSAKR